MTPRRRDPAAASNKMLVTTFHLRDFPTPSTAWSFVVTLRAAGPPYAPAAFRTGSLPHAQPIRRRSAPFLAEVLTGGQGVELLSTHGGSVLIRAGKGPDDVPRMTMTAPLPHTAAEALAAIRVTADLCAVLHPLVGTANAATSRAAAEARRFPGWLTVFGRARAAEIGVLKLLMTPAYLIDTLDDGGILIVSDPLPLGCGRHADRRSSALEELLRGEGLLVGSPPPAFRRSS